MRVGIITITDKNNYGNRLQCYALSKYISDLGYDVKVINNENKNLVIRMKRILKFIICKNKKSKLKRVRSFNAFEKNINSTEYVIDYNAPKMKEKFDVVVVGSDQVWNPYHGRMSDLELCNFEPEIRCISYAASFGTSELNEHFTNKVKCLEKFNSLSVREEQGKNIIMTVLKEKNVSVNIDPTLLIGANTWKKLAKKPNNFGNQKFVLLYFLGGCDRVQRNIIEEYANRNNYIIIDIFNMKSEAYTYGPAEFLYLEEKAELICTDSFHSSVFAFMFNKPFIIFERKSGKVNMSSRIDTLLSTFHLINRRYNGISITKENLEHDYTEAYKILEIERTKSETFLKKALEDIKG